MQRDDAPGPGAPASGSGTGGVFSPWATLVYGLVWVALTALGWRDVIVGGHEASLGYPLAAAERVVDRDLYLASAIDARPAHEAAVWSFFEGRPDELRAGALEIQRHAIALAEETAGESAADFDAAHLREAVILAEVGRLDEAVEAAAHVSAAEAGALLTAAYGASDAGSRGPGADADAAALGARGWAGHRLDAALARRRDSERVAAIEADFATHTRRALLASAGLHGVEIGIVVAALALLAIQSGRGRIPAAPPERRRPPPWTLATGVGVLVRGDVWSRVYFLALAWLPPQLVQEGWVDALWNSGTLFASLPLAVLAWRHLIAPHRESDPVGLRPRAPGAGALVGFTLVIAALDRIVTQAVGWLTWSLDAGWSWAESFDEVLAWSSTPQATLAALDLVVWAPVFEELAFRGILYLSLRRALSTAPAALVSAAIFSLLHFYSLAGFLTTFASGLVWTLAFERVRSLWPGVGAHALYNALYVAGIVLYYR